MLLKFVGKEHCFSGILCQNLSGVKSLKLQFKLFYLVSVCERQGDLYGFLINLSCISEKIAIV